MEAWRSAVLLQWPWAALVIGLGLAASAALEPAPRRRALALLPMAFYMLHQFEEHGVDLFGTRYAFQPYACRLFAIATASSRPCAVTQEFIFAVNIVGVHASFLLPLWAQSKRAADLALGLIAVNCAAHVLASVASQTYNPGAATALVLFVPLLVARLPTMPATDLGLAIVAGVLQHLVLIGSVALPVEGLVLNLIAEAVGAAIPLGFALATESAPGSKPPAARR